MDITSSDSEVCLPLVRARRNIVSGSELGRASREIRNTMSGLESSRASGSERENSILDLEPDSTPGSVFRIPFAPPLTIMPYHEPSPALGSEGVNNSPDRAPSHERVNNPNPRAPSSERVNYIPNPPPGPENPDPDLELGLVPGVWRFTTIQNRCCIYRVPACLRGANPEAYTPQLVIIGPLHHYLKSEASNPVPNTKSMDYFNMEKHKKHYLRAFSRRLEGDATIDQFKRIIRENEDEIRESYSELTTSINSEDFVNMILHDSVFILEFILRCTDENRVRHEKTGDLLIDEPCVQRGVKKDLILLENQLPYFILGRLFNPVFQTILPGNTLRGLIIYYFRLQGQIEDNTGFRHFTDLFRCVRVRTLPDRPQGDLLPIQHMSNADKLDSGGVRFNVVGEEVSIKVSFNRACLEIPPFVFNGNTETTLRNIMALEQCHYPFEAHVCSYMMFLDYLIATEKDVDLLVEKGIIRDCYGNHAKVAETMKKLSLGVVEFGSYYHEIAASVDAHINNRIVRSCAKLKQDYFKNKWRGTATFVAGSLVLMTSGGLVVSIMQTWKAFHP